MVDAIQILRHYAAARYGHRFRTRREIEAHQEKALERFKARVLAHTVFYKDILDHPFDAYPMMDKASVREHFAGLNTLGISFDVAYEKAMDATRTGAGSAKIKDVTVGLSTGTSGNRGVFLVTRQERMKWLGVVLAKALPGCLLKPQRIALMLSANSDLYRSIERTPHIQFRFFSLFEDWESHLDPLAEYAPTILIGTAQSLTLLAREQVRGRLSIHPRKIISGGEVLDPVDQAEIETAFGTPVDQIYQCTEGFFGITCQHGSIHLNEEYVRFEKDWIDEDQKKFIPIITDFSRDTQALVRYRMNDILTERATACPCGSPLLAISRIEGRSDDMFLLPDMTGTRTVSVLPDVIRNTVIDVSPNILDYRIRQVDRNTIEIALPDEIDEETCFRVQTSLEKMLQNLGCAIPTFRSMRGITPSIAAKLRRVQRCADVAEFTS